MERVNPIKEKSYALAVEIVRVCRLLQSKNEYIMSKQLLRSGTSVGANVEEAIQGQSRPDFISKMSIAHKEAFETSYWVRLLVDTDYLSKDEAKSVSTLLREVLALLTAILKKTKQNNQ